MDTLQTGQAQAPETFDSVNPATSEVIATFPVFGQAEVDETVRRAHDAAAWWAGLDWKERQTRLLAWKSHVTRYIGRLAELVH
ncbi:MAG: aldehyde dehydrogenase family protein, partial [Actinobacteria bacterium]|nr:aldehyde dehydrogenase family protein [Actinomycetota bacterium]